MRVEIRNDSVLIDGYVNAVGRDSKPIRGENGERFLEQIVPEYLTWNKMFHIIFDIDNI